MEKSRALTDVCCSLKVISDEMIENASKKEGERKASEQALG